jgi:hypothetical protein
VSLVWNYPTVAEMAVYIARQLRVALADKPDGTPPAATAEDGRTAEIAELSDEEVLHMLQEKLGTLDD